MPQQTDFIKMAKLRKPKLNMFWWIKHWFCPPWSTVLNATFCSHREWEYPDPHCRQKAREQPQSSDLWPAHTYQSNLCFPPVHCSICLASHWGWSSWLAIQREQTKTRKAIQHVSLSCLWLTTFTPVPWANTPGSAVKWLWGTQPFSAVLCGGSRSWQTQKTSQKGSPEFTVFYLNLAAEITYKQAADVVPDGGKILWHIERLLLPKIHSLLSRIQPFHKFLWVSVVAKGGNKTQKHRFSWGWDTFLTLQVAFPVRRHVLFWHLNCCITLQKHGFSCHL